MVVRFYDKGCVEFEEQGKQENESREKIVVDYALVKRLVDVANKFDKLQAEFDAIKAQLANRTTDLKELERVCNDVCK